MNKFMKFSLGAFGVIYTFIGLAWWVSPDFVAPKLGMSLLTKVGLSTQIADLASFFMVMGICILISLKTNMRTWIYPSLMLLSIACFGRFLSWAIHGATFALDMIIVELITIIILVVHIKINHQDEIK